MLSSLVTACLLVPVSVYHVRQRHMASTSWCMTAESLRCSTSGNVNIVGFLNEESTGCQALQRSYLMSQGALGGKRLDPVTRWSCSSLVVSQVKHRKFCCLNVVGRCQSSQVGLSQAARAQTQGSSAASVAASTSSTSRARCRKQSLSRLRSQVPQRARAPRRPPSSIAASSVAVVKRSKSSCITSISRVNRHKLGLFQRGCSQVPQIAVDEDTTTKCHKRRFAGC
ncbi:uncharacterized protein C8Q71DRAFT_737669 [Rhodofomes roseus]|uniref:Secreted protein n=1 Tax=Rhodofomes roseus TaxID=34475 RepID=A0ABQ8KRY0_9APHY|nr:uncharacterized protein C8Q71DRAFT_737669 [Rhodofomes roseus]KAH9841565.1 hypothetical protein C8Q71DRAFT_737669 [Rhodofomes roseus]